MKKYLLLLKEMLMPAKHREDRNSCIDEGILIEEIASNAVIDDSQLIIAIADKLGLEVSAHSLKEIISYRNSFYVDSDNMIFLYPPNDGFSTRPFEFFKGRKMVISNQNAYSEITNLDEILLEMVRLYNNSLDNGIVLDPYYFMLRLDDEVKENYKGRATLVITDKAIRNQKLNEQNFDKANKHFINRFLDHFIGWNFGVSVNRDETLKRELEALNQKVIDKGIRRDAGTGWEVYGSEDEVDHGLQHYYLPVEKVNVKKKARY